MSLITINSTFDPLGSDHDDDLYIDPDTGDENDILVYAFDNFRRNFHDIYCDAVALLNTGASYGSIDEAVTHALTAINLPECCLEHLASAWIPLYAAGIDLADRENWPDDDHLITIIKFLDPSYSATDEDTPDPEHVWAVGHLLHQSLKAHLDNPTYKALSDYIGWLCSCSGTSLIDCSFEAHDEFEPLVWDNDDSIEFAQTLNRERDDILQSIILCRETYFQNPHILAELKRNATRIHRHLAKKGNAHDQQPRVERPPTLQWRY